MKKSQGLSIVFAIIMIALFSVFAFLYPIPHTTNFWLGYFFEIVAVVYLAINVWGISKSDDSKVRFLGMPTVLVAWIYVFIQTGVSLLLMLKYDFSTNIAIIIEVGCAVLFFVFGVLAYQGGKIIKKVDDKTEEKTDYIKSLLVEVEMLKSEDAEIIKRIDSLYENVRFSDPVSHSELKDLEDQIKKEVESLTYSINNKEDFIKKCDTIDDLLKRRNVETKKMKGKDDVPEKEDGKGGLKIVVITLISIGVIVLAVVLAVFVFAPASKYKDACQRYEDKDYLNALIEFEELGNYKDSLEKSSEIRRLLIAQYAKESSNIESGDNELRNNIINQLMKLLKDSNITVNNEDGTVTISSDILFSKNSARLSDESKTVLKAAIPVYMSVVLSDDYVNYISEIDTLGHTDTQGTYELNMDLSKKRAEAVKDFILSDEMGLNDNQLSKIKNLLVTEGLAYTKPVYLVDNQGNVTDEIDMDKSRRVEIRFKLK